MRSILRLGLSVVLATVLAASAAWAVDYDDIFELTERNVDDRTIVQLIVDDGRAFELTDEEIVDLRIAGVSEHVIDAMIDPAAGKAWLAGDIYRGPGDVDGGETGNGYRSSLDEEYGQGGGETGNGVTPLVFSFGYYYGPLSRYYYDDPYYYPFLSAGYAYSYWPSYYAYGWRPLYDEYYAYPYNWYEYSSYYCHTYYDPGYWTEIGYTVQPASGPTVWDDGPRFRGGGIIPPKGGRPDAVTGERLAVGGAGRLRNPAGPPAIREAETPRTLEDRVARTIPVTADIHRAEAPVDRRLVGSGVAVRGGSASSAVSAERRARALAAREGRAAQERANAQAGEAWARIRSEENIAAIQQLHERWARDWQERQAQAPAQASEEPSRSRPAPAAAAPPPPPPPPPAPPAREEQPRAERAPAPDRGAAAGRGDAGGDGDPGARRGRGGR